MGMALISANYFSKELMRIVPFQMVLPNDVPDFVQEGNVCYQRNTKTLFLLHGFTGNSMDWITGSLVRELSQKYNLAVVMPSGDNSFYVDAKGTGRAYATFIGEGIVRYVVDTFCLSGRKEDMIIGGMSMGGFGALLAGLKYSDTFGKIFGFSNALIIHKIKNMQPGMQDEIADYDYYTSVFGKLDEIEESDKNPEYLIKKLKKEGKKVPPIYMACGTKDFLLEENREFSKFLKREKIDHEYHEDEGIHDWSFWNHYLESAIKWAVEDTVGIDK